MTENREARLQILLPALTLGLATLAFIDTRWMTWVTLVTVVAWLFITQKLRVQIKRERSEGKLAPPFPPDCERFPDQCPCTTELGKGSA